MISVDQRADVAITVSRVLLSALSTDKCFFRIQDTITLMKEAYRNLRRH